MSDVKFKSGTLTLSLRWVARLWSLGTVGLLLLFFVGEGFAPSMITPREWVLLLFFPVGLILGLGLAWRWEGWGGLLAFGSVVGFYVVHYLLDGRLPQGPFFALLGTPGLLFVWCWLLTRQGDQHG